jgi:CO dehydrogenase/acetyl-CoA synthase gamma subunit (corrinoid Fe-S protein)
MTAPITKPVIEDQGCFEIGGNREKNFLIKTQFAILYYSIIEKIRKGDQNMPGIVLDNRYIQVLA